MRIIKPNLDSPILDSDYRHALVHLAWYREDSRRFLLFGMVELFPSELPSPDPTKEQALPVRSLGRRHSVYVRRIVMTAEDALAWYAKCREGHVMLPNTNGEWDLLVTSQFREEPAWPNLLTTHQLPFHNWGTVRAHHLVQTAILPEARLPLTNLTAVGWLTDKLFFNFLEFGEWLGSISLIAPNPVLRNLHHTLAVEEAGEASDIHLIERQGHDVHKLVLYLGEHRYGGVVSYRSIDLDGNYLRIFHVGRTEQVSLALVCPQRGVLEWHDPVGFLRQIGTTIEMASATKIVKVPDTSGRPGETYEQTVMTKGGEFVIGDTTSDDGDVAVHFNSARRSRERKEEAGRLGQKLFHGDENEARSFVRGLISQARQRVWIVDPYFTTPELFAYALATSRSEVDVKIVTSAERLRGRDQIAPTREAGEVLLEQVKALSEKGRFEILVMTGSRSPIHDRFLVIDDDVWLSGNSLHSIGERAGMMIKLPAPELVMDLIMGIINPINHRAMALKEWVRKRKADKKKAEQDGKGSNG